MTPVGHSIMGATIAVMVMPTDALPFRRKVTLAIFVLLANVPDLPFPGWGHDHYPRSHSLLVNVGLLGSLAVMLAAWRSSRVWAGGCAVLAAAVVAGLSHIMLDATYRHGLGLGVLWPMSDWRLALPVPFLDSVREPFPAFSAHTARVMGIEALFYGALFCAALGFRRYCFRR